MGLDARANTSPLCTSMTVTAPVSSPRRFCTKRCNSESIVETRVDPPAPASFSSSLTTRPMAFTSTLEVPALPLRGWSYERSKPDLPI